MSITLSTRRRTAVLALGAALALGVSACGSSGSGTTPATESSSSSTAGEISAEHNDGDVAFINDMAPHHSGAVAMAELAPERAGSAAVKDLAARIAAAQAPEVETMKAMATAWGVSLSTDPGSMTGTTGMGGMGMGDDVSALTPLRGAAFDREFLTRMTAHHTSALEMARAELAQGQNAQAKELATSIIASQEKEITEMAELLKTV